jgi:putative effector of murein hydrolase LrgA (UPF0299 family)
MSRGNELRTYYVTVVVVAVLSVVLGLIVASLTEQYAAVFFAQMLVAGLLGAWCTRIRKRSASKKWSATGYPGSTIRTPDR